MTEKKSRRIRGRLRTLVRQFLSTAPSRRWSQQEEDELTALVYDGAQMVLDCEADERWPLDVRAS